MKLAVGADHAGYDLKVVLLEHLRAAGHDVVDLGTADATTSVDWPDYGRMVAEAVVDGVAELGICVCGSGIGVAIAASKVAGCRAATVHDVTSAHLAREHNHANVCCLGARLIGPAVAIEAVDAFLAAQPLGDRHARRVAKLDDLDQRSPRRTS